MSSISIFNQTCISLKYYLDNKPNSYPLLIFFVGLGIKLIIDNYKEVVEDTKTKEINDYREKYYTKLETIENKDFNQEELAKLKDCILEEKTSYGNVYMFYNNDNETFNFYCNDKNIPYTILDAIARNYAITYDCKSICINYKEEWEKAKKIAYENYEKKKKKELEEEEKEKEKTIFVKYKYKKNMQEDEEESSSEEENNILLKIMNKRVKKKRHRIKIEKTNRFTYKGNINDYELLKKTPTKNFLKKDICFKNFKSL